MMVVRVLHTLLALVLRLVDGLSQSPDKKKDHKKHNGTNEQDNPDIKCAISGLLVECLNMLFFPRDA